MIKYCKTCVFKTKVQDGTNRDACSQFKILINPEEDYCSQHMSEGSLETCEMCGAQMVASQLVLWYNKDNEDKPKYICHDCRTKMYSCTTCSYKTECGFMSDHSEPPFVMKTVQQGFMTMQTQVKNPNLIEKHCINCRCSADAQGTCMKEENGANCGCWSARTN